MESPQSPRTQFASAAGAQRRCYCKSSHPELWRERGIPEGFCGICERCGKPGHTQHFPGPLPYTGAWCDRCVKIVALTWPLKNPAVWTVVAVVVVFIVTYIRSR